MLLENNTILETQSPNLMNAQKFLVAYGISFLLRSQEMMVTIQFNGKRQRRTIKVKYMLTHTVLTPEMQVFNLVSP